MLIKKIATPGNLLVLFLFIFSIIILSIRYTAGISKILYNDKKTNDILSKLGIYFEPNRISISEQKYNLIKNKIIIEEANDKKAERYNYYILEMVNGNPKSEQITDLELSNFVNFTSKAYVGYDIVKPNYDRRKINGFIIDMIKNIAKEFGGIDLFDAIGDALYYGMSKNNKLLNYPGEGLFNLPDNDVLIYFISEGNVYVGFIDGLYYKTLVNKIDDKYYPGKYDIIKLNNITSGKGFFIFLTISLILIKLYFFIKALIVRKRTS